MWDKFVDMMGPAIIRVIKFSKKLPGTVFAVAEFLAPSFCSCMGVAMGHVFWAMISLTPHRNNSLYSVHGINI